MDVIRKILYLSVSLILCIPAVHGQLDAANIKTQPTLPTLEAYDFIRYGNIGASLYTGTINYSVPIYSYEDADFTYSLSADYSTNGFRVNEPSGALGLGWSLSCPGKIVREVNEIPDEGSKLIIAGDGTGSSLQGYKSISGGHYENECKCHQNNTLYPCLKSSDSEVFFESQPDVYSFNFCGYSGQFRRDRFSKDNENVLLFNLSANSMSLKVIQLDEQGRIEIQDGKGYIYTFTEESFYFEEDKEENNPLKHKITKSWCLDKITAPNGRKLEFSYTHVSNNFADLEKSDITYHPTLRYNFTVFIGQSAWCNSSESKSIETVTNNIFNSRFSGVILPDGEHVSVNYSPGVPERYYTTPEKDTTGYKGNYMRVSNIEITYNNKLIKKATFDYDIRTGYGIANGNRYTFLRSIDITGIGKHSFEYYTMAGYPPLATTKSDHWGYYNGNSAGINVTNIFSNLNFDPVSYDETYTANFRKEPNFEAALSGSLKKICYPTGGTSTIEYEPHDCSQKLKRDSKTRFIPVLDDVKENGIRCNTTVGGIRLKRVVNNNVDGTPVDTVSYTYRDDEFPELSSGLLINAPRYGLKYDVRCGIQAKAVEYFSLTNSLFNYNHIHIEYSHVREIRSNGGYKDYFYTNYRDFPDHFTDASAIKENGNEPFSVNYWSDGYTTHPYVVTNPSQSVTNILTPIASGQIRRGLLKEERQYTDGVVLKKKVVNSYIFPVVYTDTVQTITGEIARDIYYPRYNIQMCGTTEYDYFKNGQAVTTSELEYNDFGSVAVNTVKTSDGKTYRDRYYYSGDKYVTEAIADTMKTEKVNGIMLRQEHFEINNGVETMTEGRRYSYYSPSRTKPKLFCPEKVDVWRPASGWESEETYRHDGSGLVTQVTDSAGDVTSFIWSYAGRYPILLANRIGFTELKSEIGTLGLNYETLRDSYEPDIAAINSLRGMVKNNTDSHISLYTYKPVAGMTEATLPNGLRTYYVYDGYSRLTDIRDHDGSVSEHSDYNIFTATPFSADFNIPSSCRINQKFTAAATGRGGSSVFVFYMRIMRDNIVIDSITSDSGEFVIDPVLIGLGVGNSYIVEVTATDIISGESTTSSQTLTVESALIEFSDISEPEIDFNGGNGSISANIYTDAATVATFNIHYLTSGSLDIYVGRQHFRFNGRTATTFTAPLSVGDNAVKIEFTSSYTESLAELTVTSAPGHELGTSTTLTLSF